MGKAYAEACAKSSSPKIQCGELALRQEHLSELEESREGDGNREE